MGLSQSTLTPRYDTLDVTVTNWRPPSGVVTGMPVPLSTVKLFRGSDLARRAPGREP
jgi:hypothetical protein